MSSAKAGARRWIKAVAMITPDLPKVSDVEGGSRTHPKKRVPWNTISGTRRLRTRRDTIGNIVPSRLVARITKMAPIRSSVHAD